MTRPLDFDPILEARRQWEHDDLGHADAMTVVLSVMRVQQLFLAEMEDVLRPVGLTFARYEALVLLMFSSTGALPMGKMGERLQVHPTSVTNTVNRLERGGLVRRVQHLGDRRMTLAEITESGRELAIRVTPELTERAHKLTILSDEETRGLIQSLRLVRKAAGDFV